MTRLLTGSLIASLALLAGMAAAPVQAQVSLLGDTDLSQGSSGAAPSSVGPAADPAARPDGRAARDRGPARRARTELSPYLELDQAAIRDLKGGSGDMLTYTTVAAGLQASIQTQKVELGADLRYAHQFAWDKASADQDIVSGIVNGRLNLLRDLLSVEGGGMATRVRSDGTLGANNNLAGVDDTSRVYSAYVGPIATLPIGGMTATGSYRLGYSRLQDGRGSAALGPVASFDESWMHDANASLGMRPGLLPFGWTLSGRYARETASQLDQRYIAKSARADIVLPVAYTLALVGSAGYEKITISNRDAKRDAVTNAPVRDAGGRFVTDPASPRRLSYDQAGLIWDAGVMWRPSPRLEAEARIGRRYGSTSYTGRLDWTPNERTALNITLFDSIDSFGRALNGSLANLGTDFSLIRNPFTGDIGGCAFPGGQAGGVCFNDALTGISTANYRNRGVFAGFTRQADPWAVTVAAGYSRRTFLADSRSALAAVNGLSDQNYYASLGVSRPLDAVSSLDARAYVNYYDSGVTGIGDVTNMGANLSYRRTILRRLQASAAIGLDSIDREGEAAMMSLLAQIGLRYQF